MPHRMTESFPRDRWREKILNDLKFLVAFLNYRFHDGPTAWQELGRHPILGGWMESYFREKPFLLWREGGLEEVHNLQTEIACNVDNVINPIEPKHVDVGIALLVSKLNHTLKSSWSAALLSERTPKRKITPYEDALILGGVAWTVSYSPAIYSFEQHLYWCIGMGLQSGEFTRLKRCKHCNQFFLAEHDGRECCSSRCSNSYSKRDETLRKRVSRVSIDKKLAPKGLPHFRKLAGGNLKQIRVFFGERFETFIPFAQRVKQREAPEQVWQELPPWMKKRFTAVGDPGVGRRS